MELIPHAPPIITVTGMTCVDMQWLQVRNQVSCDRYGFVDYTHVTVGPAHFYAHNWSLFKQYITSVYYWTASVDATGRVRSGAGKAMPQCQGTL